MCVVLFSYGDDKSECSRLQAVLKKVVPQHLLEVFTKFEDFSARIRHIPRDIEVAVLSVRNDQNLTALLSLADYLDSIRIILLLPEFESDMIRKGHLLRPRYLAFLNGDYSDVGAVMSKMIKNGKSHG